MTPKKSYLTYYLAWIVAPDAGHSWRIYVELEDQWDYFVNYRSQIEKTFLGSMELSLRRFWLEANYYLKCDKNWLLTKWYGIITKRVE